MERASGNHAFVCRAIEMKRTSVLFVRRELRMRMRNCLRLVVIFSLVPEELKAV